MLVYRISLAKWSDKLVSSGNAARWNSKGVFVLYTAGTRALACLENVVHRDNEGLSQNFRTMIIQIPETIQIVKIPVTALDAQWKAWDNNAYTRSIGDEWVANNESAVLEVPSVIIPEELNYVLNPAHPEFRKIKLIRTELFAFDSRIKK